VPRLIPIDVSPLSSLFGLCLWLWLWLAPHGPHSPRSPRSSILNPRPITHHPYHLSP
jgi:hypothetical protein